MHQRQTSSHLFASYTNRQLRGIHIYEIPTRNLPNGVTTEFLGTHRCLSHGFSEASRIIGRFKFEKSPNFSELARANPSNHKQYNLNRNNDNTKLMFVARICPLPFLPPRSNRCR